MNSQSIAKGILASLFTFSALPDLTPEENKFLEELESGKLVAVQPELLEGLFEASDGRHPAVQSMLLAFIRDGRETVREALKQQQGSENDPAYRRVVLYDRMAESMDVPLENFLYRNEGKVSFADLANWLAGQGFSRSLALKAWEDHPRENYLPLEASSVEKELQALGLAVPAVLGRLAQDLSGEALEASEIVAGFVEAGKEFLTSEGQDKNAAMALYAGYQIAKFGYLS